MLQPATKALAQTPAGRAGFLDSQIHARNLLAHAERLINDRVHNRLIPVEREEFFEQLARLRLTWPTPTPKPRCRYEEQVEKEPPRPVAQERLKEMALALSRPNATGRCRRVRLTSPMILPEPPVMPGERTKLAGALGEVFGSARHSRATGAAAPAAG